MRPICPLNMPTILGAPSVVMLASLDQSSPIVWHTSPKISSPIVVPFKLCRAASSSDTSKFELTLQRNISSCAVSCISFLSSSANANNLNSFTFSCSWAYTLSPFLQFVWWLYLRTDSLHLRRLFYQGTPPSQQHSYISWWTYCHWMAYHWLQSV